MSLSPSIVVVLVTAPRGKGGEIARRLVEERLAACVNIVEAHSIYWWRGRVEEDDEDLLIVKTRLENLPKLVKRVKEIHPYEVPEIIAVPVIAGLRDYIDWVVEETGGGETKAK